jgi:hypothetical protein
MTSATKAIKVHLELWVRAESVAQLDPLVLRVPLGTKGHKEPQVHSAHRESVVRKAIKAHKVRKV